MYDVQAPQQVNATVTDKRFLLIAAAKAQWLMKRAYFSVCPCVCPRKINCGSKLSYTTLKLNYNISNGDINSVLVLAIRKLVSDSRRANLTTCKKHRLEIQYRSIYVIDFCPEVDIWNGNQANMMNSEENSRNINSISWPINIDRYCWLLERALAG